MSLAYMRFYPQDYLQDTNHLTTQEHGAYLLLIINYWQTEKPLPDNDKRLSGICRMSLANWQDIRPSIEEFFTITDDGWRHERIQNELFLVDKKSERNRANGKKGGLKKAENQKHTSGRNKVAKRSPSHSNTNTDTNTDKPIKQALPDWLPQSSWDEWIQHRKEIRKPMTPLAMAKAINKLKSMLNGVSAKEIIDHSIANGYQGLYSPGSTKQPIGSKRNERIRRILEESNGQGAGDHSGNVPLLAHSKKT